MLFSTSAINFCGNNFDENFTSMFFLPENCNDNAFKFKPLQQLTESDNVSNVPSLHVTYYITLSKGSNLSVLYNK